jgi:hypothetical protein
MKSANWQNLLRGHPIFSSLNEEIRKLLEAHLEMQVKMYTLIRDRLRQASQP